MSTRRQLRQALDAIDGNLGGALPDYIVCDSCGRIWDVPTDSLPIGCPRCDGEALWSFRDLAAAWEHAHLVRARAGEGV